MYKDCELSKDRIDLALLPVVKELDRGTVPLGNCLNDCQVFGNQFCCKIYDVDV